jgi:hypothetical protein
MMSAEYLDPTGKVGQFADVYELNERGMRERHRRFEYALIRCDD